MNGVRSFIYLVGQILSAMVVCLAVLLVTPFPRSVIDKVIASWARFNLWTLKWVCGITYRVSGLENIPDTAAIIVSNHQSTWETLCFQRIFPPLSFILKKQLLWIPFFGWGLAAYKPIAIDRSKKTRALDQLINQGKQRLSEGRWLVIYPEGTRMPVGQPAKFQIGGAMIAAKSGAPIVPVAHNAGLFWGKNSFIRTPGVIDVVIGPMIETTGLKAREINQQAENWVLDTLSELPGIKTD